MVNAELGTKIICANCGARYYDLNREPVICPKCQTPNVAASGATETAAKAQSKAVKVEYDLDQVIGASTDELNAIEGDEKIEDHTDTFLEDSDDRESFHELVDTDKSADGEEEDI